MAWHYRVYGLSLRSTIPLRWAGGSMSGSGTVNLAEGPDSLFAQVRKEAERTSPGTRALGQARLSTGARYIRWPGFLELVVSAQGRHLTYRSLNGSARETFRTFPYLLTHTLSFSLFHQGIEPLHATTVVVNGRAVAFLGDSGYGKSSLGAAFLRAGHSLLTDDLLVIKPTRQCVMAYPGLPLIKLYPHVATRLLGDRITGVPMNPHTPKLMIPLSAHRMTRTPRPVSAIYVLRPPASDSRGKKTAIRPFVPRRAVFELMANTFNLAIKERDRLTRQFDLAIRLAAQLPVKSLSYPRGLTRLPAVVQAIQADLRADPAS